VAESVPVSEESTTWTATGIGSLPGTDPAEAARLVAGELPQWPHLPELPARGAGADMIGRAMALLGEVSAEFAVATAPTGWQRTSGPGRDMRRAASFFQADCEAAEQFFDGYRGPFTVPIAGPWTLAAAVTDGWGERSLRDAGFVADLCQAHAEASAGLVRRFARILPGAELVVSLDEPLLAAVHDGALSFSSGYRRHAPVGEERMARGLQHTREAVHGEGARTAIHTCAPPVWPVLRTVAPDLLSLDAALLGEADLEPLGRWLESGAGLVWGVWPTAGDARRDEPQRGAAVIAGWLHRLGLPVVGLPGLAAVSPRCGLAGAGPAQARAAMWGCREVARRLSEADR
jgi:methionine synthase II (cobalamin-independent)